MAVLALLATLLVASAGAAAAQGDGGLPRYLGYPHCSVLGEALARDYCLTYINSDASDVKWTTAVAWARYRPGACEPAAPLASGGPSRRALCPEAASYARSFTPSARGGASAARAAVSCANITAYCLVADMRSERFGSSCTPSPDGAPCERGERGTGSCFRGLCGGARDAARRQRRAAAGPRTAMRARASPAPAAAARLAVAGGAGPARRAFPAAGVTRGSGLVNRAGHARRARRPRPGRDRHAARGGRPRADVRRGGPPRRRPRGRRGAAAVCAAGAARAAGAPVPPAPGDPDEYNYDYGDVVGGSGSSGLTSGGGTTGGGGAGGGATSSGGTSGGGGTGGGADPYGLGIALPPNPKIDDPFAPAPPPAPAPAPPAPPPPRVVTRAQLTMDIQPDAFVGAVPASFLGISREWTPAVYWDRNLPAFGAIFDALGPAPVVRIGGATQEALLRAPNSTFLSSLVTLHCALGMRYIVGLPLFQNAPQLSLAVKAAFDAAFKDYPYAVLSYELGNEPNYWPGTKEGGFTPIKGATKCMPVDYNNPAATLVGTIDTPTDRPGGVDGFALYKAYDEPYVPYKASAYCFTPEAVLFVPGVVRAAPRGTGSGRTRPRRLHARRAPRTARRAAHARARAHARAAAPPQDSYQSYFARSARTLTGCGGGPTSDLQSLWGSPYWGPPGFNRQVLSGPAWGDFSSFSTQSLATFLKNSDSCYLQEVTMHYYGPNRNSTFEALFSKLTGLPNPTQPVGPTNKALISIVRDYVDAARLANVGLRVSEANSIPDGGQGGLSNTLGAALWTLVTSMEFARAGVSGINYHWGNGGTLDPRRAPAYIGVQTMFEGGDPARPYPSPRVPWYGYVLFSRALGGNGPGLFLNASTNALGQGAICRDFLYPYALLVPHAGLISVVVANANPNVTCDFTATLPGVITTAGTLQRLVGPAGMDSVPGVTLAGQTYERTSDGRMRGEFAPEVVQPHQETIRTTGWTFAVPAGSAALLQIPLAGGATAGVGVPPATADLVPGGTQAAVPIDAAPWAPPQGMDPPPAAAPDAAALGGAPGGGGAPGAAPPQPGGAPGGAALQQAAGAPAPGQFAAGSGEFVLKGHAADGSPIYSWRAAAGAAGSAPPGGNARVGAAPPSAGAGAAGGGRPGGGLGGLLGGLLGRGRSLLAVPRVLPRRVRALLQLGEQPGLGPVGGSLAWDPAPGAAPEYLRPHAAVAPASAAAAWAAPALPGLGRVWPPRDNSSVMAVGQYGLGGYTLLPPGYDRAAVARAAATPHERSVAEAHALAAHLAAGRLVALEPGAQPFCAGMAPQAVARLAGLLGHAAVEEGAALFRQGQSGDRMFIVLRGYCAVLKAPLLEPDGNPAGTAAAPARSRRATLEAQSHAFALATAVPPGQLHDAAGTLPGASSRRATAEAPPGGGAGSRRTTGGSRRATGEQAGPLLGEPAHVGWVSVGQACGEAAVLGGTRPHPVSVVAGDGGVELAVLERSAWARLQAAAAAHDAPPPLPPPRQAEAGATVQAVLAAAARPLLAVPPGQRGADELALLAELLGGLDALRALPAPVLAKLARSCEAVALPTGAVVCREDEPGDAMFVLLQGACEVRARPLAPLPAGQPGAEPASDGGGCRVAAVNAAAARVDPQHAAGGAATEHGAAMATPTPLGARRTTWEGAAFTAAEQARLEAVQAVLEADRASAAGQGGGACAPPAAGAPRGAAAVERDGVYWTAQFMASAVATAEASDPHWGTNGGLTPLAAAFAARWREQVRLQAANRHAAQAQEGAAGEADREAAAMDELLGKAAARVWRAARDAAAAAAAGAGAGAGATGGGTDGGTDGPGATTAQQATPPNAAAQDAALGRDGPGAGASAAVTPPQPLRGAADDPATAAGLLAAAAAAAPSAAEALKLQLAALGVRDPADVSRRLLAEVGARADLEGLLAGVASLLERRGLPRRLSRKGSLKITRELNRRCVLGLQTEGLLRWLAASCGELTPRGTTRRRILGGASCKGWGGDGACSGGAQPGGWAGDGDGGAAAAARPSGAGAAPAVDGGSELAAEATGLSSSCDWRSSLDCSEAASSLCSSLDADTGAVGERSPHGRGVAALEELLTFLGGVAPFAGLPREALTALAVFARPLRVGAGALLAAAGERADSLIIIQEGEVKLLDCQGCGPLPRARRPTADELLLGAGQRAGGGARQGSAGARALIRQLSGPAAAGGQAAPGNAGTGDATAAGGRLSALSLVRLQHGAAPLAVLGPGSIIGEAVLGYDADQDPLAAVAAARPHAARQAAAADAACTHLAIAVAARPCRLLVLSAEGLRRFGRRVRGPLAAAAVERRRFLQARRAALQGTKGALAGLVSDLRAQLAAGPAAAAGAGAGPASPASCPLAASRGDGARTAAISQRPSLCCALGASGAGLGAARPPPRGATLASSGAIPSAAMLRLSSTGCGGGARPASAAMQWQQARWAQAAFGELRAPAQTAALGRTEVARLTQLVPGAQPPCVSELAAAARTLPLGALGASAAPAPGSPGERSQLAPPAAAAAAEPEAPCWTAGPGGRTVAASCGRGAPLGRQLSAALSEASSEA
ncbi:hypothetical protein HT031_003364 [Scenedesmus sp. PABB004]|nr:hypothetical protein HT031_003364 [Scenedesmus sp. PABB004]